MKGPIVPIGEFCISWYGVVLNQYLCGPGNHFVPPCLIPFCIYLGQVMSPICHRQKRLKSSCRDLSCLVMACRFHPPAVGLEPTTFWLTVAAPGKLPITVNYDCLSKFRDFRGAELRLSTAYFEIGSLKKSPKYFPTFRQGRTTLSWKSLAAGVEPRPLGYEPRRSI